MSTAIHTLSLHDALPISVESFFYASDIVKLRLTPGGFDDLCRFIAATYVRDTGGGAQRLGDGLYGAGGFRSEEHTSELQSLRQLVCRLLLEKKKKQTMNR